jgi:hypothetical protein
VIDEMETRLSHVLADRAEHADLPRPDLSARVETRHRRRRTARLSASAAAVALVVAGTAVGLQGLGGERPPGPAAQSRVVPVKSALPLEQAWPEAVRKVPALTRHGRPLGLREFIDDRTVLAAITKKDTKAKNEMERSELVVTGLYTVDLDTNAVTELTDYRVPAGATRVEDIVIGDGHIALRVTVKQHNEIWTLPLGGGAMRKLTDGAAWTADRPDEIHLRRIADGAVYWTLNSGGVFRMPLAGGARERLSADGNIVAWPWVGGPQFMDGGAATAYRNIRNLLTGEKRGFTARGKWSCGVTWCVSDAEARTRDGSRTWKAPTGWKFELPGMGPSQGRFVNLATTSIERTDALMLDLETGKAGRIPLYHGPEDNSTSYALLGMPDQRLTSQQTKTGNLVLDLSKIDK